jgi:hypothetical protein
VYVIVATPPDRPFTIPDASMGATVILLLLQLPPTVRSDRVAVYPWQIEDGPVIASGNGLTVIVVVE